MLNLVLAWDEEKSRANFRKRGFDFHFAAGIFDGVILAVEDRRRDYGEVRIVAVGMVRDIHLTVVFTDRSIPGPRIVRRIISARRSNRRERRKYEEEVSARESTDPGQGEPH